MSLVKGPSWCQVTGTDGVVGVGPTRRPIMHVLQDQEKEDWESPPVIGEHMWNGHICCSKSMAKKEGETWWVKHFSFLQVFSFQERGGINGKREKGKLAHQQESKRWYHLWCENPMKSRCQNAIILVADVIIWLFKMREDFLPKKKKKLREDSLSLSHPNLMWLFLHQ